MTRGDERGGRRATGEERVCEKVAYRDIAKGWRAQVRVGKCGRRASENGSERLCGSKLNTHSEDDVAIVCIERGHS